MVCTLEYAAAHSVALCPIFPGGERGPVGSVSLSVATEAVRAITLNWSSITVKGLKAGGGFSDLPPYIQRKEKAKGAKGNEKGIFHNSNNLFVFTNNHSNIVGIEEATFHQGYGHLRFISLFDKTGFSNGGRAVMGKVTARVLPTVPRKGHNG